MGVLLVIFIIAQFIVLDFAGNHGPEITDLRRTQNEVKLENDLKRATIDEMSAKQDVKSFASERLGYVTNKVNTLHKTDTQVTALGNNQ